ncbi:MAG: hypothetical protein RL518_1922 [Pseudomonadota bacterium]|jgi:hypothetical protein
MDSDILEGLPTTEELTGEASAETALPESLTSAPPAPPVDAASIEPAPQTVAVTNTEERAAPLISKSGDEMSAADPAKTDAGVATEKVTGVDSSMSEDSSKSAATPTSLAHISDTPRVDVSAATVARMMGIASTSDLRLLEGRVDLLTSKVSAILTKVDRCLSMFSSIPSASDIGRLEIQVATIKSMMKELLDSVGAPISPGRDQADRAAAQEQSRKLREGIKSNTES